MISSKDYKMKIYSALDEIAKRIRKNKTKG